MNTPSKQAPAAGLPGATAIRLLVTPLTVPHPARPLCTVVMLAACAFLGSASARSAEIDWSGAGADLNWSTTANWTNNLPPTGVDDNVGFLAGDFPVTTNAAGVVNNILDGSRTVGTLSYKALVPQYHTTLIPAGQTLSVVGIMTNVIGYYTTRDSMFVGSGVDSGGTAQVYESITGPGTLFVSNTAANIDITQSSGSGGSKMATLDLTGLGTFVANISQLRVGNGASVSGNQAGNRCGGTLILAFDNIITCNSSSYGLSIGDSPQNNGPFSVLQLGQNNAVFSDFGISVGRRKSATLPATTTMRFAPGLVSPSALFRNKAGTGPMSTWSIGDNGEITGSIGSHTSGTIDLSGGTVDALVGTIYLGRTYNGPGVGNANSLGTLTFDAGMIAANTVEVGFMPQNNASIAVGTLNVLGTGSLVVSNDLRLGRYVTGTNTAGSATGTLNVGGTVSVGGRIYDGGGISVLTLTNGIVDLQPAGDPTPGTIIVDDLILDTGTITNAATISVSSNLMVGAGGVVAGNTTIDLQNGAVLNGKAMAGGFVLGEMQTLQGTGRIFGNLIQSPGATISPGGAGFAGSLLHTNDDDPFANNSLTLNAGGRLIFDLSNDPLQIGGPNDVIIVGGDLNLLGVNDVTINPLNGELANGTYRLMEYYGFLIGDASAFRIEGSIAESRRVLTFDTSMSSQVNLNVGGSAPGTLIWAGDSVANNWDLKTSATWLNGGSPDMFYYRDDVIFDDTGSITPAVNLVGVLIPNSVTVNSETRNYTFAGQGGLSGAGGISKFGSSTLTLANSANDFTGPVFIGGGRLQIGGPDTVSTNASVILSNAPGVTLDLNGNHQTIAALSGGGLDGGDVALGAGVLSVTGGGVFDGVFSGEGRVVKNGPGTLQLSGASTHAGGTLIANGAVVLANPFGSGTGFGAVTIEGGALQIGTNGVTGSIAPQPGGVLTNHGNLVFNRNDTMVFDDIITGGGSVQLAGSGTVVFNHDNSYTNTTTVNRNDGVLRITAPGALGTTDGGTLVAGGNTPAGLAPYPGGRLELAGGVVFDPEPLTLGNRGTGTTGWEGPAQLVNASDTNTWTGPIYITQGGSWIALQSDAGLMRITDSISGGPIATGTRLIILRGAGDGEVSGTISNGPVTVTLNLGKFEFGTWTLSGNNSYNGTTIISNGTLRVNGSIGGAGVTNVGGVLGGTGLINAPVTIESGGTLAPGVSIGTLTINNTLVLNGTTTMELARPGAIVENDSVRGLTSVTYGGTLNITLTGNPRGGEVFKLFEAASYGGAFATVNLPTLPGGLTWNATNLGVDGTLRIEGSAPSQPEIGRITVSGNLIVISGTGGTGGVEYYVLTSTNVVLPLTNWLPIETNSFGPGGVFGFTNAADPNVPQRFYQLQVP